MAAKLVFKLAHQRMERLSGHSYHLKQLIPPQKSVCVCTRAPVYMFIKQRGERERTSTSGKAP